MRERLHSMPRVHAIGDALYLIGFWFEYFLICAARGVGKTVRAVVLQAGRLLILILRPFLLGLITLCSDLTAPFRRMSSGMRHMRELAQALPEESSREIRRERFRYFRRGARLYFPLVLNALAYLLPVAALAGFSYIVQDRMNVNYVLEVMVNGEPVGSVASEQVFESARDDVQGRIQTVQDSDQDAQATMAAVTQLELDPTYTLAIGGDVMNEMEVANAILSASGGAIGEATAVYIDGSLQFVTQDGDHLRSYLESVKQPYEDASDPNVRVSFVHDISLVDGLYLQASMVSYSDILSVLNEGGGARTYTAAEGDTVQTVLDATGVAWDSLAALNPELTGTDQELASGTEVITGVQSPDLLQVKVIRRESYTSEIPYDTVETQSSEYDFGETVVTSAGQNGLQEITQDITYIDGVQTEISTVSVETLQEPVSEYVTKGTHLKSGMTANYGSGEWMWPVPQYTYVSRWMSSFHKGADICAAYGTPIYASDSGVVVTAGYHYSYGNYVVIDHGNGWTTLYGHMSALGCSSGQAVERGEVIGYVGSTGNSTGNHCHFEMHHNGTLVSARNFFGGM
ncbi:MAG: peptidoglycan DD-metalloendopeptidase family protein [Gemmiger sp.]